MPALESRDKGKEAAAIPETVEVIKQDPIKDSPLGTPGRYNPAMTGEWPQETGQRRE